VNAKTIVVKYDMNASPHFCSKPSFAQTSHQLTLQQPVQLKQQIE